MPLYLGIDIQPSGLRSQGFSIASRGELQKPRSSNLNMMVAIPYQVFLPFFLIETSLSILRDAALLMMVSQGITENRHGQFGCGVIRVEGVGVVVRPRPY